METTNISLLYGLIGILTLLFAPLHIYTLGGIVGDNGQLINGIAIFAVAPVIFKTVSIIFKNNKNHITRYHQPIHYIKAHMISRFIWELISPLSCGHA